MSTDTSSSAAKAAVNGIRTFLGLSGLVALIIGILILVWPQHTTTVLAAILGIYAIVGGIVYLGLGLFSRTMGGWSRIGHLVLGLIFIAAGILIFVNLQAAASWIVLWIGLFVGIMWIVEGIVALTTLGRAAAKGLTVFFAILSIIAGIVLVMSPLWGGLVLWMLFGISLVVLGIIQIVRAFTFSPKDI